MRIKKLDERVKLLREMLSFVEDEEMTEYLGLNLPAITNEQLARATALCQSVVKLPIYTVNHAAAWLGLSRRGVVEAYRAKRLPYIQPGREVLFLHEDLVKFAQERRYEL